MMILDMPLKSEYSRCIEVGHKTFIEDDTYILVTVVTNEPKASDRQVIQFKACNDNCAANHLFRWLAKQYYVSFNWSTPESRKKYAMEAELRVY